MNSISNDIAHLIVEDGHGVAGGTKEQDWAVHYNRSPDLPTRMISVRDAAPPPTAKTINTSNEYFWSAFEVRVRAQKADEARIKAFEIYKTLEKRGSFDFGGSHYLNIQIANEPIHVGSDDKGRDIFIMNGVTPRNEIP